MKEISLDVKIGKIKSDDNEITDLVVSDKRNITNASNLYPDGNIMYSNHKEFIDYIKKHNLKVMDNEKEIFIYYPNKLNSTSSYLSFPKGIYYNYDEGLVNIEKINSLSINELQHILIIINDYIK